MKTIAYILIYVIVFLRLIGGQPMNNIEILKFFPRKIATEINKKMIEENISYAILEEIRIRNNRPILLKHIRGESIIETTRVSAEEILEILQVICNNSIYSYQNQICNGYITLVGGHRVGITGNVVITDGKVSNINYISSLNFRISKQIIGASSKALKYILNPEDNNLYNTLIVSPPGAGKTTVLRDIVRKISTGMEAIKLNGLTVGLVDERGEIAAMYKGMPQNDIGTRTDVIDNIPKSMGMKMLIRSMAPQVIVADEIGSKEDVEAIHYVMCCGIKGIFTIHGDSINDITMNPEIKKLIDLHIFERLIFLDKKIKGEISCVYSLNKINLEYSLL